MLPPVIRVCFVIPFFIKYQIRERKIVFVMSEKKSPPHKDKGGTSSSSKPSTTESKGAKRKLAAPASPSEEEDKKCSTQSQGPKRKRPNVPEGSPEHMGMGSPRGAGSMSRLNVPLSERQQMALLMRMEESTVGDASPKSPSPSNQVTSTKKTPADKKVNKRNERGEAPLHMAAKKGDYKQTKRLIKAGASVNMKDFAGWTALHEACNSGNLRVAKQLLKAGADVNVQGYDDDTPLHDASSNGHKKLVRLLVRHGANPHQANLKGKTALDAAATSEIKAMLEGHMASQYDSDSDTHSDGSSSDSGLSAAKEEDRSLDQEMKLSSGPGGQSESFTSSTPSRRQSVPPSPDKGPNPSPRLFLKFQHKKSSSEEQQRGAEWNVLTVGSEVSSHPESRMGSITTGRPRVEENWSRPNEGETCPDSTLTPSSTYNSSSNNNSSVPLSSTTDRSNISASASHPSGDRGNVGSSSGPTSDRGSVGSTVPSQPVLERSSATSSHPNLPTPNPSLPPVERSSASNPHSALERSSAPSSSQSTLERSTVNPPHSASLDRPGVNSMERSSLNLFHTSHDRTGIAPSSHPILERTATEPFTPRCADSLAGADSEDIEVFPTTSSSSAHKPLTACSSTASELKPQPAPSMSSSGFFSSVGIPPHKSVFSGSGPSIGFYQGLRQPMAKLPPNVMQTTTATSGLIPSNKSGVSSSSLSSSTPSTQSSLPPSMITSLPSSHRVVTNSGSTCQFSFVSSSSSSSTLPVSSSSEGALQSLPPMESVPVMQFQPMSRIAGAKGGSIVTGLSDRAVAARLPTPKSDTSSCDSPLRLDVEDSNHATSEHGSRPSTPKVPPLKIILPTKVGGPSADDSKIHQAKPALPYVLNPTQEGEGCFGEDGVPRPNDMDSLLGTSPHQRPTSRDGSATGGTSGEKEGGKNFDLSSTTAQNLDLDESASRESDGRGESGDGEKTEDGKEKRPTRTLRSHTAMLQQQAQQSKGDSKNGGSGDNKDEGDTSSTTRSQKGEDSTADESSFPPRKRKLRNKTEQQTMQVSVASTTAAKLNQPLEKPPNPYEIYLNMRRQIASRHRMLSNVAPKPPAGFKDFLMVNCTYVLQGNATSTLSVPMLPPPNMVSEAMRDFFIQQEKERYRLRLQHLIEREKLMLSIEQEILREHGRAARAMANQTLPFSVCTILREEEIYNQQELEQVEDRDKNVRSRYNGRQFFSWLQDVDDKYEKIKQYLLLRHHHEAESLYAVQKLDWEWKLKECGLCDRKNTPVIDELHVPMVAVSDEFELHPSS